MNSTVRPAALLLQLSLAVHVQRMMLRALATHITECTALASMVLVMHDVCAP
jgi:hypothetical protein